MSAEQMRDAARNLDGLFAGQCQPAEYEPLVEAGLLRFAYEGAAGFMGLAKLRATRDVPSDGEPKP